VVQDATRGTHHQVGALLQGVELGSVRGASVEERGPHPGLAAEHLGFPGHLLGQFAGGHEDEGLAGILGEVRPFEDGEQKRPRLAAPRARLDHEIPPREHVRNGPGLNRHERRPACSAHRVPELLGKGRQRGLWQDVLGFLNRPGLGMRSRGGRDFSVLGRVQMSVVGILS
jgi:hypothetical protein